MHFRATRDMSARKVGKRKGAPGRTVFGPHLAKDGSVGYYHHAAVKMRMRRIGRTWFCELTPDYCFTSDGREAHRYENRLLAGIKRLDRHAAVAGWIRTWAEFLRGGEDLFSSSKLIEFGELEALTVDVGIDDRVWGPAPAASEPESDDRPDEPAAELSSDGQDAREIADLLALFTGDDESHNEAVIEGDYGGVESDPGGLVMRAHILAEPELEFGAASRHIDPRFGIGTFGPADLGSAEQPKAIRLGLIGAEKDLETLKIWLEGCRDEIPAKDGRYPHLFPAFPGCDIDRGLCSTVVFSDRATNTISVADLRAIERSTGAAALDRAVEVYCDEARALAERNRVDVIVVARPSGLKDLSTFR